MPENSALQPFEFVTRFSAAAGRLGFQARQFGEIAGFPLMGYWKRTPGPRPRIYLSAGIHGDEPAPPLALLEMVETQFFDHRANWFICPLLNPNGFIRGSRENGNGIDLNRDYLDLRSPEIRAHVSWLQSQPHFDVTFCLHEDYDALGFYLYELNPEHRPSLTDAILAGAAQYSAIELGPIIDGRPIAAPGVIRPIDEPELRVNWPEAIYLRQQHTTLSYTLETPTPRPLSQRIATTRAAVVGGCTEFFRSGS